jgi:predicted Zn-dependent peptidase
MNNNLQWQRRVLPNGLRVLLFPKPTAFTTQLSVAIEYGSNDDSKEHSGTAHFLEHMTVSGSKDRIGLHHQIEKMGGCSNFETSEEQTFCMVDVLPEHLSDASKVLSGLLYDSVFEKTKLELERKVILNEIAEDFDDPGQKIMESLVKCLFKHHPVRNPTLGSRKTVNQISLEEITNAHQNYYIPSNLIVILTGNFNGIDVETVINDFNGKERSSPLHRNLRKQEGSKPKERVTTEKPGLTQAYISFGLRTNSAKSTDVPAIDLVNAILGIGESSRLFIELREKRALIYDFESMNVAGLDYGYFYVTCAAKPTALNDVETIIRKEVEKLKTNRLTKSELEKSKKLVLGDIYRTIDSPSGLSRTMADFEVLFHDEKALPQYVDKITSVTEQHINEIANKYFQDKNYSTVIIKPKKP